MDAYVTQFISPLFISAFVLAVVFADYIISGIWCLYFCFSCSAWRPFVWSAAVEVIEWKQVGKYEYSCRFRFPLLIRFVCFLCVEAAATAAGAVKYFNGIQERTSMPALNAILFGPHEKYCRLGNHNKILLSFLSFNYFALIKFKLLFASAGVVPTNVKGKIIIKSTQKKENVSPSQHCLREVNDVSALSSSHRRM